MKKIIYILIALLSIVALIGGVGTLSFFTATSATLINVFTAGTVIIDAGDLSGELVIKEGSSGDCKDLELTITNTGSKYAYVRSAYEGFWRAAYHNNTAEVTAEYSVGEITETITADDSANFIDGTYTGSSEWPDPLLPSSWFTAKDSTAPLLIAPEFPPYIESTEQGFSENDQQYSLGQNPLQADLSAQLLLSSNIELQLMNLNNGSSGPPTVNGLFYGDGDYERYTLIGLGEFGSKVYYYLHEENNTYILYGAAVIDRSVNDNVFDGDPPMRPWTDYLESAGWDILWGNDRCRSFKLLTDSEYIDFSLSVGEGGEWTWRQYYVGDNKLEYDDTNWSPGEVEGTVPDDSYIAATSIVWNMNNSPWANDGRIVQDDGEWKSPYNSADANDITIVDGYPAEGQITFSETYQWEWSMVYEFSVDVTAILEKYNVETINMLTGSSHHSPSKIHGVEDETFLSSYDWGDLPDGPYPTLAMNDGPRHKLLVNGAYLGVVPPDPEPDGQPCPKAMGDDDNLLNDEDGIIFLTPLVPGKLATIQVIAGTPGYLSAWIDFNGDGTLTQLELISATGPADVGTGLVGDLRLSAAGNYEFTIQVPDDATGVMYSRWRYTNETGQGGNSITGEALSGEVEDHAIAAIGDYVWFDENGDGIQNDGEPGAAGVVVRLLDGSSNPVLDGNGEPITTVTDEDGYYEFPGVIPGVQYRVEFVAPDSYFFTLQNQGSDYTKDSDADPDTGITDIYILAPGEFNQSIDAGLIMAPPGITLKKYVSVDDGNTWYDADAMPGPVLPAGYEPLFKFTATNTGGIELTITGLVDDKFGPIYEANGGGAIILQPSESYDFYYPPGDSWGTKDWRNSLDEATGELSIDFCDGEDNDNEDWKFYDGHYYYTKALAPDESVVLCVTVCPVDVDEIYEEFVYINLKAYAAAIQATHGAVYEIWFEDVDPPYPVQFEPIP